MTRRSWLLPMLLACAVLPGCLINSRSDVHYSGNTVASEDLARITPGKTTEPEARAILGNPTSSVDVGEGKELRWTSTKRECSGSAVFLLLSSHNTTETKQTVVLAIKDGLVTDVRSE